MAKHAKLPSQEQLEKFYKRTGYPSPLRKGNLEGLALVNVMPKPTTEEHAKRIMGNAVKLRNMARAIARLKGPEAEKKALMQRDKVVMRRIETKKQFGLPNMQVAKMGREISVLDKYAASLLRKGRNRK